MNTPIWSPPQVDDRLPTRPPLDDTALIVVITILAVFGGAILILLDAASQYHGEIL